MADDVTPLDLIGRHVDRQTRRLRMAICHACPQYLVRSGRCSACGCFMVMKTRIPEASCPADKWGPVPSD
jgi:hypothetical protein